MRKLLLRVLPLPIALAAAVAFSSAASAGTVFNSAAAPSGTHLVTGTPTPACTVNGLNVSCNSYELAGVGGTNARADLSATYSAKVVCINPGGNKSDSQHQGTFTASNSTGQISPKNGRLTVPSLLVVAPTSDQFLAQQTCPNTGWNPTIPGGITLSGFTYTVSFAGFTGSFITITP